MHITSDSPRCNFAVNFGRCFLFVITVPTQAKGIVRCRCTDVKKRSITIATLGSRIVLHNLFTTYTKKMNRHVCSTLSQYYKIQKLAYSFTQRSLQDFSCFSCIYLKVACISSFGISTTPYFYASLDWLIFHILFHAASTLKLYH